MFVDMRKPSRHIVVFRCHECDICLFCDENCRETAWSQFHRWECYGLQTHFWENNDLSHTALRILLLGINTDEILLGVLNLHSDNVCAYRYIYNLENYLFKKGVKELNTILHVSKSIKVSFNNRTKEMLLLIIDIFFFCSSQPERWYT